MAELRKHSTASNVERFLLKSSVTGKGLTGLSSASSGLVIATVADNESATTTYTVAAGNVETITTLGTYAAPTAGKCRFKEVDATNHPGLYEFQFANARYSVASSKKLIISVSGATNLLDADYELTLVQFDPFSIASLGLTNLDAAVSSRLATSGYTAPDNTNIANIYAESQTHPTLAEMEASTVLAKKSDTNTIAGYLDTEIADIQSRLPAALVGGRMDVSVGAMAANTLTASAMAADAATKVATAVYSDTLTTYTDGQAGKRLKGITAVPVVEGLVGIGSTTTSIVTNLIGYGDGHFRDQLMIVETGVGTSIWQSKAVLAYTSATGIMTTEEPFTFSPVQNANVVLQTNHIHPITQIQNGLATSAALNTVAGYVDTEVGAILAAVDTEVAAIKAKTDLIPLSPAATGDIPTAVQIRAEIDANSTQLAKLGTPAGLTMSADIAAIKAELGIAGAGLTALASQSSVNTLIGYVDTEVAAILADTNELQLAHAAGTLGANVTKINNVLITGNGSTVPFNV